MPPWKLSKYTILQIGDVHFPQWNEFQSDVDDKDDAFARRLVSAVAHDPIQAVLRELSKAAHSPSLDAIAIMGDVTSWGRRSGYESALKVLTPLLDMEFQKSAGRQILVVPGNHDVDRKLALTGPIEAKFNPLLELLEKYHWPLFPVRGIQKVVSPAKNPAIALYTLNSCLGCGEKRLLPAVIQKQVLKLVTKSAGTKADPTTLEQVYEQLDTPAIDDKAIEELASDIHTLPKAVLPIVIAHHNLLPQATPRVSPYGEMVNAGKLRRRLLLTNRTVLYLHGHIHEDPVEILTDPFLSGGRIVSIAAPQLGSGFNEIELFISPSKGALACRLHPIRFKSGHGIDRRSYQDIGLTSKSGVNTPASYKVLGELAKKRRMFFSELLDAIRNPTVPEDQLASVVQSLHFSNMLSIDNPESNPLDWSLTM